MHHRYKLIVILLLSVMVGNLTASAFHHFRGPESVYAYNDSNAELSAFNLPFRYGRVTSDKSHIVPLGLTIGVRINTEGVMVLGTNGFLGEDGQTHMPSEGILRSGDLILKANEQPIERKECLSVLVADTKGDVTLLLRRNGSEFEVTLTPEVAAVDGIRRIGTWVRDSTKGIGTLTYYVPETRAFGALGHGIMDVDTKMLITVRNGVVMPSNVTSIVKGARGKPGELEGSVDSGTILGTVTLNSPSGIYGTLTPEFIETLPKEAMPIANRTQIREGPATIMTNVVDNEIKEFDISIEGVNQTTADETKGMIIRITDPVLLNATNGIVQGMSGSPIIQNGRIIGAVTHVFVQDPTKGYGIFIESMLQQKEIVVAPV